MSDVRRLNLEEAPTRKVSLVSVDKYKLGPQGLQVLTDTLPKLMEYDYWSPEYQAWEPLVQTYLTSGSNPELAGVWLPRLSKKISRLGPPSGLFSEVFGSVLYMNKVQSTEAFVGYHWDKILQFVQNIPKYIDNQKIITDYIFSKANYTELEAAMVAENHFIEAIYLYRHCMFDTNPTPAETCAQLSEQLNAWVQRYSAVFESVASMIDNTSGVYAWYTREVKDLICNAWLSSMDLSYNRSIITRQDVAQFPIWLSEQLTAYLCKLPCVMTVPVDKQYTFDALEYAFDPEANLADPQMIYAFCIPRDYIKNLFITLSEFYWMVADGRLVPYLISRVEAAYSTGNQNVEKTPDEYRKELLSRGFPAEGL